MRTPLIAGNWKMNLTLREAETLGRAVAEAAAKYNDRDVLIYPTFLQFVSVAKATAGSRVAVGVQNCSAEKDGAFTGEISASQAKDAGAAYVLLGHSERRHVIKESDSFIKQKVERVLDQGLRCMLCVGETLSERESGNAESVVLDQLNSALAGIKPDQWKLISIAYEPVWAIGTGKNATPDDAQKMHATIRQRIADLNATIAPAIRILYGGSVKPENIGAIMAMPDVDGALVGGASLKADSFADLIKNAK